MRTGAVFFARGARRRAARRVRRASRGVAAGAVGAASAAVLSGVVGGPMLRSSAALSPPRPHGLSAITATFGAACNSQANDSVYNWPWVDYQTKAVGPAGQHVLLAGQHASARYMIALDPGDVRITNGFSGYFCKMKSGGSGYSTHAWGISIDTNTSTNPNGQNHWNGVGSNGKQYKQAIPDVWRHFLVSYHWGLTWSDPHHFQYATGY